MPIHVICSGCHKRFTAPDRFAGKRGPCPHCKTIILVPLPQDQVVIQEPEEAQAQRLAGRSIFKPLRRESQGFSRLQMVMVGVGILFVLLLAILIRGIVDQPEDFPKVILIVGTMVVAYPVSIGGYLFLRDEEMGSFDRRAMLIRTGICAIAYCLTWGIYAFLTGFIDMPDNPMMYAGIGVVCLLLGGIAPWAALDFDYTNGLLHCGFYIVVCVALCFVMGAQHLLWVLPS